MARGPLFANPAPRRTASAGLALCAAAATALSPDAGRAAELSGYAKAYAFQGFDLGERPERLAVRMQLGVAGGAEAISYAGSFNLELATHAGELAEQTRGAGVVAYPVELYLALGGDTLELRLGKQYVLWGRTSWTNPTDVVTPWDYVNIASELEDRRTAPTGARLLWYPGGDLSLDLVWIPIFSPALVPVEAPSEVAGLPVREQDPPERLLDWPGQVGLRLSHTVSELALDWSLAAFYGRDTMPRFEMRPVLTLRSPAEGAPPVAVPEAFTFARRYDRLWMVGGDVAKSLGPFVFAAEAAYKIYPHFDDPALVRPARAEAVLGVTYAFEGGELTLQYGVVQRLHYDASAERERLLRLRHAEPAFVPEATEHQVMVVGRLDVLPDAGLQVVALGEASYLDGMVLGFAYWNPADALRVTAGAIAFGGADSSTPMARQRDMSRLFVEVKYSF